MHATSQKKQLLKYATAFFYIDLLPILKDKKSNQSLKEKSPSASLQQQKKLIKNKPALTTEK